MEQHVRATIRIDYSANAELAADELRQRVHDDAARLLDADEGARGQLEATAIKVDRIEEEAAIYGNETGQDNGIGRYAELQQLATDCMESSHPGAKIAHGHAAECARRAAANDSRIARELQRTTEASHFITAVYCAHEGRPGDELTTAELLLVAAMIAARAEGAELPRAAASLGVGDLATLCRAMDFARQFIDDWKDDEGLDAESRDNAEQGDRDVKAAEELLASLPAPQQLASEPIRILVNLEGGLVQDIIASASGVRAVVIDYDTDGVSADELFALPQDSGGTANATRSDWGELTVDAAGIEAVMNAELDDPEAAVAHLRAVARRYDGKGDADGGIYQRMAAEHRARAEEIERQLATEAAEEQLATA